MQENAASDVRADLNDFFRRLVPEDLSLYRHDEEGADDMPSHKGIEDNHTAPEANFLWLATHSNIGVFDPGNAYAR